MPGRSGLNLPHILHVAAQPLSQVHPPVVTERVDRHSGPGIHFLQVAIHREDHSAVGPVLALPVIEAPIRRNSVNGMRPDLSSGGGIESHNGAAAAHHVHDIVDHHRAEGDSTAGARRLVGPSHLELVDVGLVDLFERGVLHGVERAAELRPGRIWLLLSGGLSPENDQAGHQHQQRDPRQSKRTYPQMPSVFAHNSPLPIRVQARNL